MEDPIAGSTLHLLMDSMSDGVYFGNVADLPGNVLDPMGWMSQKNNPIRGGNTTAPTHYLFAAGHNATSAPNSEVADWNEGTMIANAPVMRNKQKRPGYPIGYSANDQIEQWWTNNFGAAGVAYSEATSTCQTFEGGTYCTHLADPYKYTPLFKDVPIDHWAHRYIGWANREGVISGYNDAGHCGGQIPCYLPNVAVTRAQLAKIIVEGFQIPIDTTGGPHFVDVAQGTTFYSFIETAYNRGIISGYSCGSGCLEYRPGVNSTRGQMSKMIAKAAIEVTDYINNYYVYGGPDYFDVRPPGWPNPSPFFLEIESLYVAGVVNNRREHNGGGNGGSYFEGVTVSRGMAAQFIHEVLYASSPP